MTGKRFTLTMGEFGEENIFDSTNEVEFTEISDMCNKMNDLADELDYWKKRALLLENKYGERND